MNPWKLTTGAVVCAAAFTFTTAATASSPAPSTLDHFKAKYRCHDISKGNWSPGADLLAKRRGVKTTLFVVPGEKTVMIRKGSNKAETAAASSYGQIRMVCGRVVPWAQKPELGS